MRGVGWVSGRVCGYSVVTRRHCSRGERVRVCVCVGWSTWRAGVSGESSGTV